MRSLPLRLAMVGLSMSAASVVWAQPVDGPGVGSAPLGGTRPIRAASASSRTPLQTAAPQSTRERGVFERLMPGWPSWLTLSVVDRGRLEAIRAPAAGEEYDAYVLNRLRVSAALTPTPWLLGTVQIQDSRVAAYALDSAPKSMSNPHDLRLASIEIGRKAPGGVVATIGRQELTFGDGRIMASPDWGNVSRTYDGVRVSFVAPRLSVDLFGAAPVDVTPSTFSRAKQGERVFGAWLGLTTRRPRVEAYTVVKHAAQATGETGSRGDQVVYAVGIRAGATPRPPLTWEVELVAERGHVAADPLSAWGGHLAVSWTAKTWPWRPRLGAEYNVASGDANPADGTRTTFDQMYASTHGKWGVGDQIGWRNMHHLMIRAEWAPRPPVKVTTALNYMALETVQDAWYGASGNRVATHRAATSRSIGWEPDVFGTWTVTRHVTVGAGVAVLLSGGFVQQAVGVTRIWTPYVTWTVRL